MVLKCLKYQNEALAVSADGICPENFIAIGVKWKQKKTQKQFKVSCTIEKANKTHSLGNNIHAQDEKYLLPIIWNLFNYAA